jgi:hypothetical protein
MEFWRGLREVCILTILWVVGFVVAVLVGARMMGAL